MNKLLGSLILMLVALVPCFASAETKWEAPVPPEMSTETLVLADAELQPGNVEKTRVVLASEFYEGKLKNDKPSEAEKNFWLEARAASGGKPSEVTGWYEKSFTETVGMYVMAFKDSTGYVEAYAGPTWKPVSWLRLGAGIGREKVAGESSTVRHNIFVEVETEKFYSFTTIENGGSGYFNKITAMYKATESVNLGLMHEIGLGLGPRVEYAISKDVQTWIAFLRNKNARETTAFFAVNFSF